MQAQFFDQPVLEGFVGPLDPAFSLWGVGRDEFDVQGLHGPSKLGHPAAGVGLFEIDFENAVLIAIESSGATTLSQIAPCGS